MRRIQPVSNVVQTVYVNQAVLRYLCPTSGPRHQADAKTSAHKISYIITCMTIRNLHYRL